MSRTTHRARREQKRRRQKLQNLRKRHYLQKLLRRADGDAPMSALVLANTLLAVEHNRTAFERARYQGCRPVRMRNQRQRRRRERQNPHLRSH